MISPVSPARAAAELLRRRRGRESLAGFAGAIEIPGKPLNDDPDAWLFQPIESSLAAHHILLMGAIERTIARRHGRLMVFMPPGSAKSTYCSVVAPSYIMGKVPGTKIILASYGSDLARRHGRKARQIVASAQYPSLFDAWLSDGSSAADEWALTNGSEYLACGILSGVTGNRANGLLIDDPIKGREQADSATIRDKTWAAYSDDLLTRLVPGGWVVIVQTRWHEDDLAGRLLPKGYDGQSGLIRCQDGKDWEVLNLPAQCERDDDPLGRKPGEYLWPEWFDDAHWDTFRRQARTWAALFQQRPRPDGGGIFKEDWCRERWNAIPVQASTCVHSWDTAQKEGELNDNSALTVWDMGRSLPSYYLRECLAEKMEYPTLRRRVITYAERDNPAAILIEDKSSGQSLIQDLRNSTRLPIVAIEPEGNKVFRASEVSPAVEAGKVILPHSAPWLADFEQEFFGFPLSTKKDRVDSVTQFLKWVSNWSATIESHGAGMTRVMSAAGGHDDADDSDEGYGSVRRGDSDLTGWN